jgi:hypothetical protein
MNTLRVWVAAIAIGATGLSALAQDSNPAQATPRRQRTRQPDAQPGQDGARQPGQGRPGALSPEKAKAAWELEATGVAKRLGLKDDQTKALIKAYTDARTSQNEALDKAMKAAQDKARDSGDEGGGRPRMDPQAMQEMNKTEKAKFETAIKPTLSADQSTKVLASLGTFSRPWDQMTDILAGFNLDASKKQDAQNAVEDFVVATGKARAANAGPDGDREAMRTAMQEANQKLTDSLKKDLSDEQMTQIQSAMSMGRGGGPGGGRRPRDGGDNSGGDKPAAPK